ncbi:serine/threonine-protein phosphatase 6 regulatory ankyrin repeat subunit A-like [Haliotis rufescens]|uniref:serine/threonine-protein phosphatase 6 regulatory ankyrin repeat subunit A-like n=1 Tax=Haliotis rufescens TaxID=6454 RepID=UPI00201FB260|nr:serine/threonine-protein phosphatase 6 regulatory ankyrin repeat subunit A-like [Haliotis rufescens]
MLAAWYGHKKVFDFLVSNGSDVTQVSDDDDNILHFACLGGNIEIVKYILEQDFIDINSRGKFGRTPVMKAAWGGHVTVFDLLERVGADLSVVSEHGDTILHLACNRDNVPMVKHILSKHIVGVNCRGKSGRTPVMIAAMFGHRGVLNVLVDKGGDVSLVDSNGENLLHVACRGGSSSMVLHCLSKRIARINSKTRNGQTPVMLAAEGGHGGVFDLLVGKGADLSLKDGHNNNILHLACSGGSVKIVQRVMSENIAGVTSIGSNDRTPLMFAAERGHTKVIDLLRAQGCDLSVSDVDNNNLLHIACLGGHIEMVLYVLRLDLCDMNSRGKTGQTPLMFAALRGNRNVFDVLVSKGGDPSLVDDDGNNILHVASLGEDVEMVKYVLSLNIVDINSGGKYGRTAAMLAAESGHRDVFYFLVCKGSDMLCVDDNGDSILHVACIGGHVQMVECIVSLDIVDINSGGQYGGTPLMSAAEGGHRDVMDLLISRGGDVSLVDDYNNNILHVVCIGGNTDIVKYVLSEHVVDINSRGEYGRTPVMIAARWGHKGVFDLLVSRGADVSLVNNHGDNILHVACYGGHLDMVKHILYKYHVNLNITNQYGRTAVMIASRMGHLGVVDLLVRRGADVSLVNHNGDNLLHVACSGGHLEMVEYVVLRDMVDINGVEHVGMTPLMLAAKSGHIQVFDFLVSEECDVSVLNVNGDNILHVACSGGDEKMVKHIIQLDLVDVTARNHFGSTAAMVAREHGHQGLSDNMPS